MGFLGLAVPHKDFGSKTWCLLSKEALDSPGTALVPENQMFIYVCTHLCALIYYVKKWVSGAKYLRQKVIVNAVTLCVGAYMSLPGQKCRLFWLSSPSFTADSDGLG